MAAAAVNYRDGNNGRRIALRNGTISGPMLKTIRQHKSPDGTTYDFEYVCPCPRDIVGKPAEWDMWQRRVDWDFAWDVERFENSIRPLLRGEFRGRVREQVRVPGGTSKS